jgi:hypothetical protein
MALATYSDLKAAVASWLNRTDLTTQIPDFITLAESRLNRLLKLRLTEVEASLSLAQGARSVALPSAFIEPIALWDSDVNGRRELRFLGPTQLEVSTIAQVIEYWAITGANIEFECPSDKARTLILRYVQGFGLTDASPTNWLLTNHPDVYLFAALVEAAPFLRDAEALGIYDARLQVAIKEVNEKEGRSRSLTTLSTDVPIMRHRWAWATDL